MRSIFRLILGGRLIEVQELDKPGFRLFNVSYGSAVHQELTQAEAQAWLGRFVFHGLQAEGRFNPPQPQEITVDYDVLERQLHTLAQLKIPGYLHGNLVDGVFELLDVILKRKPFREVKDK